MAYIVDPNSGDIVISGFDQGIGASPYSGLTDLKSVNIGSVPGEASVNFSTVSASSVPTFTSQSGTISALVAIVYPNTLPQIETGQVVSFSTVPGGSGLSTGTTPYFVKYFQNDGTNFQYKIYSDYALTSQVTTGTNGAVIFSTYNLAQPKHFVEAWTTNSSSKRTNFLIDSKGQIWTDYTLTSVNNAWTFTGNWQCNAGNSPNTKANGNGLVYWRTSNSTAPGDWDGWLISFRDDAIDYSNVDGVNNGTGYQNVATYTYGWNPATGTVNQSSYLSGTNFSNCPHNAIVAPDGRVYFCDYYNVRKIYQTDLVTPTNFSPTNTATYTYNTFNLLSINDVATCLSPFGTGMLIGGLYNQAYNWDTFSNLVSNPILLAEAYVANIITINTNAYIFCGNRGNIYITNGSQANPWIKVPDHISNTSEPYFQWGGAVYNKGKLYFGVNATNNAGTAVSGYGGIWAVDLMTKALYLSNQLSYGTYSGYATALFALPANPLTNVKTFSNTVTNPAGTGLLIGWNSGSSTFGIDTTSANPYSGSQTQITSDAIPIGTLLKPTTPLQIEYKLATPLVANETVQLSVGSFLSGSTTAVFTSAGTTTGSNTSIILSDNFGFPVQAQQWHLLKATLTSTATSPSYVRLKEMRIIKGLRMQ